MACRRSGPAAIRRTRRVVPGGECGRVGRGDRTARRGPGRGRDARRVVGKRTRTSPDEACDVRLVIEPGAAKDFDAAVNWYARVGRDLAAGFVAEMVRRVAEVLAAPESYPFAPDQRYVRKAPKRLGKPAEAFVEPHLLMVAASSPTGLRSPVHRGRSRRAELSTKPIGDLLRPSRFGVRIRVFVEARARMEHVCPRANVGLDPVGFRKPVAPVDHRQTTATPLVRSSVSRHRGTWPPARPASHEALRSPPPEWTPQDASL